MNERFGQPKSLSNCPSLPGKLSIIDILGPSGFLPFLYFGAILLHDLKYSIIHFWTSQVAQVVKDLPAMQETQVRSLGKEDPFEKGRATCSSILAWSIPWTEEPGRLQSMGLPRTEHNWATSAYTHTHTHTHTHTLFTSKAPALLRCSTLFFPSLICCPVWVLGMWALYSQGGLPCSFCSFRSGTQENPKEDGATSGDGSSASDMKVVWPHSSPSASMYIQASAAGQSYTHPPLLGCPQRGSHGSP